MLKSKRKSRLRGCLALACIFTLSVSNTLVYAVDDVKSLEDKTSNLQNELSGLNSELSTISAELDSIVAQMESVTQQVDQTKIDLANAKAKEDAQYQAMKSRIQYMYEGGQSNFLEILLSANSMADFLNKAEFVTSISDYDRSMLNELIATKEKIAQKEKELEEEQNSLITLKENLDTKEAELTSKISSTSSELSTYSSQLERAKAAAAAAKAALEAKVIETDTSVTPPKQDSDNPAPDSGASSGGTNTPTPPAANTAPPEPSAPSPAPTEPEVTTKPPVSAEAGELDLFAALLQCEAGSTNYDGLLAVASVVMNRVRSPLYPNTIRGVIYQSGQFSPTWGGQLDRVLASGAASLCYTAASDAMAGANNIGDCMEFRAAWSTSRPGIVIGGNVFF